MVFKASARQALLNSWQQPNFLTVLLWPLSLFYRLVFAMRKGLYRFGILSSYTAPVPVVVVGNISVGGTGKTPLVIYLVEQLRAQGFKPGVISRGYGGQAQQYPLMVSSETPVVESGDEPALIVRRAAVPMAVGPDRRLAIELLLKEHEVDVIISDDGLQHLALNRDVEICLVDDTSPQRNQYLLPAGPNRESKARLGGVDLVVRHGAKQTGADEFAMHLHADKVQALNNDNMAQLDISSRIHAVAGIGNPQRFFETCRNLGFNLIEHCFADHHQFVGSDVDFADDLPVLMTEKDAVKCQAFADQRHWYLPVDAKLESGFIDKLNEKLKR